MIFPAVPQLPLRVCADHLALLGARRCPSPGDQLDGEGNPSLVGPVRLLGGANGDRGVCVRATDARCVVGWQPRSTRATSQVESEVQVQALSGLMAVHGRDRGAPARLGLDVASIGAGVAAAQGVLACVLAQRRGLHTRAVETSVLEGALLFLYHHVAIATCGGETAFPEPGPVLAPPFPTADGGWIELEVLGFNEWKRFWSALGVECVDLMEAWIMFVYRYVAGRCGLPAALGDATRRHDTASLERLAAECGAAACRLRSRDEVFTALRAAPGPSGPPRLDPHALPWTIDRSDAPVRMRGPRLPMRLLPLSGFRVVESTTRLQGPMAGALLRALGAEVIKVEPPGGDFTRWSPPLVGDLGAGYLAYNREKKVVEIDYKTTAGKADLIDLIEEADVFLHNWRPGRAEELGLAPEWLLQSNPTLVYAHASGWGPHPASGPAIIAGDYLVQAYAGCGEGLRPAGEPPFPSRVTLVDVLGGMLACEGILAALCDREARGSGSRVDTSLYAAALALHGHLWAGAVDRDAAPRVFSRAAWSDFERPIRTADGYLTTALTGTTAQSRLASLCGPVDVGSAGGGGAAFADRFAARRTAQWEAVLDRAGVPATRVTQRLSDLPDIPAVRPLLQRMGGSAWIPRPPWFFEP